MRTRTFKWCSTCVRPNNTNWPTLKLTYVPAFHDIRREQFVCYGYSCTATATACYAPDLSSVIRCLCARVSAAENRRSLGRSCGKTTLTEKSVALASGRCTSYNAEIMAGGIALAFATKQSCETIHVTADNESALKTLRPGHACPAAGVRGRMPKCTRMVGEGRAETRHIPLVSVP